MIKLLAYDGRDIIKFSLADCSLTPEQALSALYMDQYDLILVYLTKRFPSVDIDRYEGGISDWWGMGSVTMYELGMKFGFEYEAENLTVTIS